jgi:hypothetical protein
MDVKDGWKQALAKLDSSSREMLARSTPHSSSLPAIAAHVTALRTTSLLLNVGGMDRCQPGEQGTGTGTGISAAGGGVSPGGVRAR